MGKVAHEFINSRLAWRLESVRRFEIDHIIVEDIADGFFVKAHLKDRTRGTDMLMKFPDIVNKTRNNHLL